MRKAFITLTNAHGDYFGKRLDLDTRSIIALQASAAKVEGVTKTRTEITCSVGGPPVTYIVVEDIDAVTRALAAQEA